MKCQSISIISLSQAKQIARFINNWQSKNGLQIVTEIQYTMFGILYANYDDKDVRAYVSERKS